MAHTRLWTSLCSVVFFVTGCSNTPSSSASSESLLSSDASSIALSEGTSSTSSGSVASSPSSNEVVTSEEPSVTSSLPLDYPFTPGEKGAVPINESFVEILGHFPGLYIEQIDRQPLLFVNGTTAEALLRFPTPLEIGATHFRLQTYQATSSSWVNFGEGDDYLTDYNNFIVPAINDQRLRLLAIGGLRDGDVSNEVGTFYVSAETILTVIL